MKKFRTVDFGLGSLLDVPQDVPLPRIGEKLWINDCGGIVEDVKHSFTGSVHVITITVNTKIN